MRVGIYHGIRGGAFGGAEIFVAATAERLSREHQVEILHHNRDLTGRALSAFSGRALHGINFIYIPEEPQPIANGFSPWSRMKTARSWYASLSKPYDLFINSTHGMPPFCHSRLGVLLIHFPSFDLWKTWPWCAPRAETIKLAIWNRMREAYHAREWRARMDSYEIKLVNSGFTKLWTRRRWGIECDVLYPPVQAVRPENVKRKEKVVLSVGRFSTHGVSKKQLELVNAFRETDSLHRGGWKYVSVGAVGTCEADIRYFEQLCDAGAGFPIEIRANLLRAELDALYHRSAIFWHAAGYDIDEDLSPELAEHFGITTVEAMSAGCVPVVVNKGGQREIVQHGTNGFLWNSLQEMTDYTKLLASDDQLRLKMSEAARVRAASFTDREFQRRLDQIFTPYLERKRKAYRMSV